MLSSIALVLEDVSFSVAMPRMMYVPSRRLGIIMRLMQASILALMLSYGLLMGGCYNKLEAVDYKHAIWFQPSDENDSSRNSRHCVEPTAYWFSFGSFVTAKPSGCKRLPWQVAYDDSVDGHTMQGAATNVFVPTFIQDDVIASGWFCETNSTRGCSKTNHTKEDFFTANVEEQFLTVFHGFKVEALQHVENDRWAKGSSTSSGFVTHIVHQDGSDCHVGGRSLWMANDATGGITGRLREWLACAGANLDADPRTFLTPAEDGDTVGLAPHLRTMGFSLQLVVDYRSNGDNMEGVLRVNVVPRWTVRKKADLVQVSDHSDKQVVLRERTAMGVAVSLKAVGVVPRFDAFRTLQLFIDSIVLFLVPVHIMQVVILFCLGNSSKIYRYARGLHVDIYRDFHCSFAQTMVAMVGFRALVGAKTLEGSAEDLPGLTVAGMLDQLRCVFEGPLSSGDMHVEELQEMVNLVFRHLDRDDSGEITCSEFIRSFTAHDIVKPDDAVHFFGSSKREKKGWMPTALTTVLDDSQRQRRGSVRSLGSTMSTEFDTSPSSQTEQSNFCESEEHDFPRSAMQQRNGASSNGSEAAKRREAGEAENEVSGWSQGLNHLVQAVTQAPHLLSDQLQGTAKDLVNTMCSDHMKTIEATLVDLKRRLELLESTQMKEVIDTSLRDDGVFADGQVDDAPAVEAARKLPPQSSSASLPTPAEDCVGSNGHGKGAGNRSGYELMGVAVAALEKHHDELSRRVERLELDQIGSPTRVGESGAEQLHTLEQRNNQLQAHVQKLDHSLAQVEEDTSCLCRQMKDAMNNLEVRYQVYGATLQKDLQQEGQLDSPSLQHKRSASENHTGARRRQGNVSDASATATPGSSTLETLRGDYSERARHSFRSHLSRQLDMQNLADSAANSARPSRWTLQSPRLTTMVPAIDLDAMQLPAISHLPVVPRGLSRQ